MHKKLILVLSKTYKDLHLVYHLLDFEIVPNTKQWFLKLRIEILKQAYAQSQFGSYFKNMLTAILVTKILSSYFIGVYVNFEMLCLKLGIIRKS